MAHGYPDYGNDPTALALQVTDLGELAARLGSPYNLVRSGKVIFIDTFDDGITRWVSNPSGDGTVTNANNMPYSGLKTLRLTPPSSVNGFTVAYKYLPLVRYGVYAAETLFHFNGDDVNPNPKFMLEFELTVTPDYYIGEVTVNPVTGDISIFTRVNGSNTNVIVYSGIGNMVGRSVDNIYNYLHLSINTDTKKYKLLIINDINIDLSSYDLAIGTSSLVTSLNLNFIVQSAGNQLPVDVDNVIVVIDEP